MSKLLAFLTGATDPDDPRQRRHAHTCSACGHVFVHDPDACIGKGATDEGCALAHVCPRCGHEERWVDVDASEPEALASLCPIDGSDGGATCPKPTNPPDLLLRNVTGGPLAGGAEMSRDGGKTWTHAVAVSGPTYASNGRITDLDAAGFRYTGDPRMGGALDGLLGLIPQAEQAAQGFLGGAATQAGQAGGQALGAAAGSAVPQVAAAIKAEIPGLAETAATATKGQLPGVVQAAGQAAAPVITPIATQAGQAAGAGAGKGVRQELEAEKDQLGDVLKVGGMVAGAAAVVGLTVWALWPKKKKGAT